MELLHEPPAGFEIVANAFAMAKLLPTTHRMNLQVGLMFDGVLFAKGLLDGYRQVTFFCEHLRDSGWNEYLLGGAEEMFECDMLFSHPADRTRQDDDPSFIRRAAVELWPAESPHAES
jgi:hypothetical protein